MKTTDTHIDQRRNLERSLAVFGGLSTMELDKKPVDEVFEKEGEIVCRHYARLAKGVFSVLKEGNANLRNTWVSCYSARADHLWNQAMTLQEGGSLQLTFFDPTSYDFKGSAEAVTDFHLGDRSKLKEQVKKAEGSQK